MKIKQTTARSLAFLGAAIHQGQNVKGVERAPSLFRKAGLFNHLQKNYNVKVKDYGDIEIIEEQINKNPPVEHAVRNLNVLGTLLGRLHQSVYSIIKNQQEELLLTVGGDHSIGSATISGVKKHYKDLRVVWVDAHPDCTNSSMRNPQKIHSQKYHGMPLSHVTGMTSIPPLDYWKWLTDQTPLDPKNVVLIGIRDIDPDEYITLQKYGVKCFTMDHVDKYGIGSVMTQTLEYLDPKNQYPFHLSFDVDAIDPQIVGQTGTRYRYGLNGRESVHIVRRLAHERKLVSMDVAEVNQNMNETQSLRKKFGGQSHLDGVSQTLGLGIDIISSAFTKNFIL